MGNTPSNTADGQQHHQPPTNGAPSHHRRHSIHTTSTSASASNSALGKDGKRRKSIELPDLRDPGLTFTRARDPSGGAGGSGHSQQTSAGSGSTASTQGTLRSPAKESVRASSRVRHGSVGGGGGAGGGRRTGLAHLETSPFSSPANDQESPSSSTAAALATPVSAGIGGPPPFLLASGGSKAPASTSTSTSSPPIPSSLPINSGIAGLTLGGSAYDTPDNATTFGIGDSDTQTSMTPSRPSTFRTIQTPMPFPIPPDHPPTDTIVAPPLPLLSAAALTTAAAESGADLDAANTAAVLASGSKVAEAVEAAEAANAVSGDHGMASLMGVATANAAERAAGLVGAASGSGSLLNGSAPSPPNLSQGSVDRAGLPAEPHIPLPSPGHSIAAPLPSIIAAQPSAQAAAVDVGGGPDAVPTLITFKNEDVRAENVFVTGTFAKGWKTKVKLAKKDPTDFSAIVSLPPGPHTFKFIVDKQWKTSKHLPSATDADGNLINYVQVNRPGQQARQQQPAPEDDRWEEALSDEGWTSEIPAELVTYGDRVEATRDLPETGAPAGMSYNQYMNHLAHVYQLPTFMASARPPAHRRASTAGSDKSGTQAGHQQMVPLPAHHYYPPFYGIPPPTLPAQLEKGVLNFSQTIAQGSGDDNSLLMKPDHSQLNHLAASPIRQGLLTVAVTTRYKGKYVTTVYHKPVPSTLAP